MKEKPKASMEKPSFIFHLSTRDVASTSIFAALYVALGYIPLFYIFGSYGQYITAALIFAPIIGIVLGPVGGGLATAIGGIIGMMLTGNMPMGIFSFLPGTLGALCVGLTYRGKWYVSAVIFAFFIIGFAALPSIGAAKYYVWLHALALLLLMSPASTLAVAYTKSLDPQKLVFGVSILAFIGVLVDHIVGSMIYQLLYPLPESVWATFAFVYPLERLLVTIVAAIIGVGIIKGVKASGLNIGEVIA